MVRQIEALETKQKSIYSESSNTYNLHFLAKKLLMLCTIFLCILFVACGGTDINSDTSSSYSSSSHGSSENNSPSSDITDPDSTNSSGGIAKEMKIAFFEAESYDNFSDTTPGNEGGEFRAEDVDIEAIPDTVDEFNVGWWTNGEWISFNNLEIKESGNYQIFARVASLNGVIHGLSFNLNAGKTELGAIDIPKTNGWQEWVTVRMDTTIEAGTHSFAAFAHKTGFNLDWIMIRAGGNGISERSLVFSDEFNEYNTDLWKAWTGDNVHNYELQWYSDNRNVSIQFDEQAGSNVLVIEARQETGGDCWWGGRCEFTSGKIETDGTQSFQYGRIEARMKLPKTQGIWPAFWMLGDDFHNTGWPQGGELDIMEHVNDNNWTTGALHGPGYSGNTPLHGGMTHDQDIDEKYSVYAIEWTSERIDWYVDDINFYSVTRQEVERYGEWVYDQPYWLIFNIAVGGHWPGDPDFNNYTTQRLYVDYVRVYEPRETLGTIDNSVNKIK